MRLSLLLQEAKALGLPPPPPPLKTLKKLHIPLITHEAWLKRKLATLTRAEQYRGDASKVKPLRAEILTRLQGPVMKWAGEAKQAAASYLAARALQDAEHVEITRMETNLAGLQGKISQLKPDFAAIYSMDDIFELLDSTSTAISIATSFYDD